MTASRSSYIRILDGLSNQEKRKENENNLALVKNEFWYLLSQAGYSKNIIDLYSELCVENKTFTPIHEIVFIILVKERNKSILEAFAELSNLNAAQASGIAKGLTRDDVILFTDESDIEKLVKAQYQPSPKKSEEFKLLLTKLEEVQARTPILRYQKPRETRTTPASPYQAPKKEIRATLAPSPYQNPVKEVRTAPASSPYQSPVKKIRTTPSSPRDGSVQEARQITPIPPPNYSPIKKVRASSPNHSPRQETRITPSSSPNRSPVKKSASSPRRTNANPAPIVPTTELGIFEYITNLFTLFTSQTVANTSPPPLPPRKRDTAQANQSIEPRISGCIPML